MPVAVFVCGAPGVGKTSLRKKMLEDMGVTEPLTILNIDDIKLPDRRAAQREFARRVEDAVESNTSFLYDATCRDRTAVMGLMDRIQMNGYTVKLAMIWASKPTVLQRLAKRTEQPIPAEVAAKIYDEVEGKLESFMKKDVDDIYLYNNEVDPVLIYTKTKGCLHKNIDFYFSICKSGGTRKRKNRKQRRTRRRS